ncbi:MAG: cobalt-precorrin 5A hydrolase [Lachnospiraceae bacterium]|nr:cobalt-precorrin 5A hydrolase [Lachnospiraceae bacterium]
MRAGIVCFTENGVKTALKIKELLFSVLAESGESGLIPETNSIEAVCCSRNFPGENKVPAKDGDPGQNLKQKDIQKLEIPLKEWTKQQFSNRDVVIFVGAAGIAVRSIAPFLQSKATDPAVLVADEKGTFVISLLSGHIGGANELCSQLAKRLQAIPVITTATDLNGKFAVDVFAKQNGMWIDDMVCAKEISAAILYGEKIGFSSDFPVTGSLPEELQAVQNGKTESAAKTEDCYEIHITWDASKKSVPGCRRLCLVPKTIVLGVGCKKGKTEAELEKAVLDTLHDRKISIHAVKKICSIDIKAKEAGLLEFCEKYHLAFETYPADALRKVKGEFSASEFVSSQVGVDNVCERSAVLGSGGGQLIQRKKACGGITVAAACEDRRIYFE